MKPTNWVMRELRTGMISLGGVVGLYSVCPHNLIQRGRFEFYGRQFAATAELAMEVGWLDMATAWRDHHDCPVDCPMTLCSSEECPKVKMEPDGFGQD